MGLLGRPRQDQRAQRAAARKNFAWRFQAWAVVSGWLVLAVAGLALSGCGHSRDKSQQAARRTPATPAGIAPLDGNSSPAPAAASPAPASPPVTLAAAPPTPPPATPTATNPPDAKASASAASEAGPLPENIADWKRDHYYRARRNKDPRLIEAVMYLGEHFSGSEAAESAALLLANLLKPEEKPKEEPKKPGGLAVSPVPPPAAATPAADPAVTPPMDIMGTGNRRTMLAPPAAPTAQAATSQADATSGDMALLKAIVYALGATKSVAGREVLRTILAGTAGVTEDRVATAAALESLGFYRCPENEAILLTVLSHPESIRKPEAAPPAAVAAPSVPAAAPAEKPEKQRPPGFPASGVSPTGSTPAPSAAAGPPPAAAPLSPFGPGLPVPTTVPTQVSAGSGKVTLHEMQVLALTWLKKVASPQTRTALARILDESVLPEDLRTECLQFLLQSVPENAEAQMLLFRSPRTSSETKAQLGPQFTRLSSEALAAILGIPAEAVATSPSTHAATVASSPIVPNDFGASQDHVIGGPLFGNGSMPSGYAANGPAPAPSAATVRPAEPHAPLDAASGYQLAGLLWSDEQATAVQGQLAKASTLSAAMPSIVLASTMPLDANRAALYQLLRHQHLEGGPAALESSGLYQDLAFDPGFLAVVKSMPRKDRPLSTTPSARGAPRRTKPNANGATSPETPNKELVPQEWMRLSEATVRTLCTRLKAAGRGQDAAGFPLEFPPNATVTACFRWEWPTEEAKAWSNVSLDPIKVYYACFQLHGRPNVALGFYKNHRMVSPVVHELDKDLWAETFRLLPNTDRRQSLDVLITVPASKSETPVPSAQQPEVDLTIEVLSIEVKDPAPAEPSAEPKGEAKH